MSFALRSSLDEQLKRHTSLEVASLYFAGRLSDLRKKPRPHGYDRNSLSDAGSEFDYSWYESAYQEFHKLHSGLKKWVPITDNDELKTAAQEKLLYFVQIDGQKAGLIAAQKKPFVGVSGAYMTELLLLPPFRGGGLAPALQRKFIDALPSDIELIWGTIYEHNLPSMKTAARIGRLPVRSKCFVQLF